jgi:Gluconate 2-dehydrogenase subunit 3
MSQAVEATASDFTEAEKRALAILADLVIPASAEYGVPGAGDPAIVETILADAARHRARLGAALSALDALARERHDAGFADLPAARRDDIVEAFRAAHAADADLIAALTAQCYYRDDRVVRSLGMELRPPHPLGYTVDQGDWSLLDPVRRRQPFFRKT